MIRPDMGGASAYDAFMILCDGIQRAKSTAGKAMRDPIAATTVPVAFGTVDPIQLFTSSD
jgi:hypothetical protein